MTVPSPEKRSPIPFQRNVAFVGVALFIAKVIAWQMTGSDAVFSDAMESIVNIISAFMGLYALYLAAKPRDSDHPYGHGKVEFITSGIEGTLIILAGIMILVQATKSIINGNELQQLDWGMLIILATAVVNYLMGWISIRKGKAISSPVLVSSGKHLQSDTVTTVGVFVSLIVVRLTGRAWLDAVVAAVLAIYIMSIGYKILRRAISGIMDEKDEDLVEQIAKVLQENRKVEWIDIHNMKVQQYGASLHIDAHITLPWYYSLREAHKLMEEVIQLLAANTERTVEFNFHMDDCRSISCPVCRIDCPVRVHPFTKEIEWNLKTITQPDKHTTTPAVSADGPDNKTRE